MNRLILVALAVMSILLFAALLAAVEEGYRLGRKRIDRNPDIVAGVGVIEAATLYLVPARQNLIGPLLVFRTVYYIVPLMIGLVTLGVSEMVFRRKRRARPAASAGSSA